MFIITNMLIGHDSHWSLLFWTVFIYL